MGTLHIRCDIRQCLAVIALPEQEKAVHAEIVAYQPVHGLRRKFFTDVAAQKRGMASFTKSRTVRNVHCQRHSIGYFLHHDAGHLRNVLQH